MISFFLRESKNSFVTSFASSLIMISMLSLFECITRSSSLSMEEIKLSAIVNWFFYVSDFLRLFMMSFRYILILLFLFLFLLYSKDILQLISWLTIELLLQKLLTFYWFITTFLFFWMLKNILNISTYYIFNCFSFFF